MPSPFTAFLQYAIESVNEQGYIRRCRGDGTPAMSKRFRHEWTIRLPGAVFKSANPDPAPDPVILFDL